MCYATTTIVAVVTIATAVVVGLEDSSIDALEAVRSTFSTENQETAV